MFFYNDFLLLLFVIIEIKVNLLFWLFKFLINNLLLFWGETKTNISVTRELSGCALN